MTNNMRVRLYATREIRLSVDVSIDEKEFIEWYEESGAAYDPSDVDTDTVLEFIKADRNYESEMEATLSGPDVKTEEVVRLVLDEVEILPLHSAEDTDADA